MTDLLGYSDAKRHRRNINSLSQAVYILTKRD